MNELVDGVLPTTRRVDVLLPGVSTLSFIHNYDSGPKLTQAMAKSGMRRMAVQ
jgi:hypothetical protein